MTHVIKRIITGTALSFVFWFIFFTLPSIIFTFLLLIILAQILLFEWKNIFSMRRPIFWFLMPLYPILPFLLLIHLNHDIAYRNLLIILFIVVFSFDTGSYLVGSIWGSHPIVSHVSPCKTWEGAIGGYVAACISLFILLVKSAIYKSWWFIAGFSFIVCSLSLLGDLFESYLKRQANIKDSGTILPGHGGCLDRFDGILFSVFLFFAFKHQLIHIFGL